MCRSLYFRLSDRHTINIGRLKGCSGSHNHLKKPMEIGGGQIDPLSAPYQGEKALTAGGLGF